MPVPRLVSKLKLEVMSSCLVRQGREVEAGIASLQANLPDSEARIKQGHIKECVHAAAGLLPAHHDGARGTLSGIPALQVTSSYTLLSENGCNLHDVLYSLSAEISIDKYIH